VVQRQQQRDFAVLAPTLEGLTETQSRLLLLLGSFIGRHVPQDFQTLRDEDIAEAAATLAATLETAGRGVLYEHRAATDPARHLAEELKRLLAELGRESHGLIAGQGVVAPGTSHAPIDRDAAVVLRRIERGAREAAKTIGGIAPGINVQRATAAGANSATAYRDLLGRISKAVTAEQADAAPNQRGSNLILP